MKRTLDCSSFLVGSWIWETNQQNIVGLNARDKDLQQRILKFHLLELPLLHFAFAELIMTTSLKVNKYASLLVFYPVHNICFGERSEKSFFFNLIIAFGSIFSWLGCNA